MKLKEKKQKETGDKHEKRHVKTVYDTLYRRVHRSLRILENTG